MIYNTYHIQYNQYICIYIDCEMLQVVFDVVISSGFRPLKKAMASWCHGLCKITIFSIYLKFYPIIFPHVSPSNHHLLTKKMWIHLDCPAAFWGLTMASLLVVRCWLVVIHSPRVFYTATNDVFFYKLPRRGDQNLQGLSEGKVLAPRDDF